MLSLSAAAFWFERWSIGFVALATLGLSMVPVIVARRLNITLPVAFLVAIAGFVFATIFLGEVFDFYERLWWWDIAMHGASAIAFGLLGFLFIFMMFDGDRYAAPPFALGFLAACLAVTIGSLWELFEFAMDSWFGTNMLKSGLPDVMGDLIVNALGAIVGGFSGTLYLWGIRSPVLAGLIERFIAANRQFYQRTRERVRPRR